MNRNTIALAAVLVALGLSIPACNSSSPSGQATSSTTAGGSAATGGATTTAGSATATSANSAQLPSLIPTPANSQLSKGPDNIADNGIHMHYQVNGAPTDVMNAFKSALEGKGWALTTIVTSGGAGGGGGATYTGTHGGAFGVFDGGGFNTTTYIDVCAWPSKPADPNCSRGDR